MSDRYVFAEACNATDSYGWTTPAPSPEDWQKVVEAVNGYESFTGDPFLIARAAFAAVRNMREAEQ